MGKRLEGLIKWIVQSENDGGGNTNEGLTKLSSILLCVGIIANLFIVVSFDLFEGGSLRPPTSLSKTVWVDDDFTDDPPNHKWDTIKEGIDDANNGDTVYVFNGTYRETVSIRKTISLIGEDPAGTIIDGNRARSVMGIGADGVQVSGFSLINGKLDYFTNGIQIYSNYNSISGNIIDTGSEYGILVHDPPGNVIRGNTITQNIIRDVEYGIRLFVADGSVVSDNYFTNESIGIALVPADGNLVSGNTISNSDTGIYVADSQDNKIADNNISGGYSGIGIDLAQTNWITGNEIIDSQGAIWIYESEALTLDNNLMIGGGVIIDGDESVEWNSHTIDTTNTINGGPVYYLKNTNGGTIPLDAGQVILANSHYVTIAHLNISNVYKGIQLGFSSSNTISNNTLSELRYGVSLERSTGNRIYHNNFEKSWLEDTNPAKNDWHHPVLLEGNYWSRYIGVDDGSGSGKHAIAGDGIGDTWIPYPEKDFDFYPFTSRNGWAVPDNNPPVADASGPYYVDEGSPITLDGSGSYDLDGDALQYRWDLDSDGIWDTGWSSSPFLEQTWGDDYSGEVVLEVWDGELSDTDTATVTVFNVAPTAELRILPTDVNVSLRIAGEKWHDVSIELYENGFLIAQGNLTRNPGNPNDQMLNLTHLSVNVSRNYSAMVRYTPEDDPVNGQPNGANPCWIILTFDDGEELRLHHDFNVNHPDRYVWEVDLMAAILSHGLTFEATAYDPGEDDLTFYWDFGDGTNATSFYPDINHTCPVQITDNVSHAFPSSGSFTVSLTVTDDDGGVGVATVIVVIP